MPPKRNSKTDQQPPVSKPKISPIKITRPIIRPITKPIKIMNTNCVLSLEVDGSRGALLFQNIVLSIRDADYFIGLLEHKPKGKFYLYNADRTYQYGDVCVRKITTPQVVQSMQTLLKSNITVSSCDIYESIMTDIGEHDEANKVTFKKLKELAPSSQSIISTMSDTDFASDVQYMIEAMKKDDMENDDDVDKASEKTKTIEHYIEDPIFQFISYVKLAYDGDEVNPIDDALIQYCYMDGLFGACKDILNGSDLALVKIIMDKKKKQATENIPELGMAVDDDDTEDTQ